MFGGVLLVRHLLKPPKFHAFRKSRQTLTLATLTLFFAIWPILSVHSQGIGPVRPTNYVYQPDPLKAALFPDQPKTIEITVSESPHSREEAAKRAITPPAAPKAQARPIRPPSVNASTAEVKALIEKWANFYGVSPAWLLRVANCESGYNPGAINYNYHPKNSMEHPTGLFQFLPSTFARFQLKAGLSGLNIFSADDNARVAAFAFAHGGSGEWACK